MKVGDTSDSDAMSVGSMLGSRLARSSSPKSLIADHP